ncbi:hypothetical protein [Actinomyces qiguomingii]|uniref:hypothetical protein n=1 Tax=Actinomyces qiguomingii TaxID=2057800 RepID=UPI0013048649|nr:hypothetical protein [Actinomyces qiguomingii]
MITYFTSYHSMKIEDRSIEFLDVFLADSHQRTDNVNNPGSVALFTCRSDSSDERAK